MILALDADAYEAAIPGLADLLVDTVTGSAAANLYEGMGWQRAGDISWFATMPDGELVGTTYYWKDLR